MIENRDAEFEEIRNEAEQLIQKRVAEKDLLRAGEVLKFKMVLANNSLVDVCFADVTTMDAKIIPVMKLPPDDEWAVNRYWHVWTLSESDWNRILEAKWGSDQSAFLELLRKSNNGPVQRSQYVTMDLGPWKRFVIRFNKVLAGLVGDQKNTRFKLRQIASKSGSYAIRKANYG